MQLPRLDGNGLASGVAEDLDSRDILEVGWMEFDKDDKICVLTLLTLKLFAKLILLRLDIYTLHILVTMHS